MLFRQTKAQSFRNLSKVMMLRRPKGQNSNRWVFSTVSLVQCVTDTLFLFVCLFLSWLVKSTLKAKLAKNVHSEEQWQMHLEQTVSPRSIDHCLEHIYSNHRISWCPVLLGNLKFGVFLLDSATGQPGVAGAALIRGTDRIFQVQQYLHTLTQHTCFLSSSFLIVPKMFVRNTAWTQSHKSQLPC